MSDGGVDPLSLIKKFASDEKNLSSDLFLSPYIPGGNISVRIKGVIYQLAVVNSGPLRNQSGFGLFKIIEPGKASCVELAKRNQIESYLKLLPRVNMVLVGEFQKHWWSVQSNTSDNRFQFKEPVPIRLPERTAAFQPIHARFDGSSFWYHGDNRRRDPAIARQLRAALDSDVPPEAVRVAGATPSEIFAYKILYFDKHPTALHDQQRKNRTDGERLRDALAHAGARLDGYWNSGQDGYVTVRYIVEGHTHTSEIRIDDLSVVSSGICLSGRDNDFDLTSLVGVMQQYHHGGDNDWD